MKTRQNSNTVSRSAIIKFRCSRSEKTIIRRQAAASGKKLSEYCRGQALHGKIFATRRLTSEERQYFVTLKDQNLGFARISNLVKNRDPELYHAIGEFLGQAKTLYNRFF
ncbi:hypothetical protein [uncultured Alistipes sp.]|uniref:plasmid mobilization protein n=1 Tax=Alistipes sp. TaxID=1872444 RepID=UPI002604BB68|nr:hypothetical protein [uncultured Alistipes sp.]